MSAMCTVGMIGQWRPYMTGNGQYPRFWYYRFQRHDGGREEEEEEEEEGEM